MRHRTPTEITSDIYRALYVSEEMPGHSITANIGGPVLTGSYPGEDGQRHRWHAAVLDDILPGRFPGMYAAGDGFDVVGFTVRERSSGALHHWGVPIPEEAPEPENTPTGEAS